MRDDFIIAAVIVAILGLALKACSNEDEYEREIRFMEEEANPRPI
jgi:hypothetical protein